MYMRRAYELYLLRQQQEQRTQQQQLQHQEPVQRQLGRSFGDVANRDSDNVDAHDDADTTSGTDDSDVRDVSTHSTCQSSTRSEVYDAKNGDDGDHELGANGNHDENDTDASQATNDNDAVAHPG